VSDIACLGGRIHAPTGEDNAFNIKKSGDGSFATWSVSTNSDFTWQRYGTSFNFWYHTRIAASFPVSSFWLVQVFILFSADLSFLAVEICSIKRHKLLHIFDRRSVEV
jgi:hypothetical protein